MSEQTQPRDINPDGADLDGTAEIERQQADKNRRPLETETTNAARNSRMKQEPPSKQPEGR